MNNVSIPVLLGTRRTGRQSEHVAHFIVSELEKRGIKTQLFDPREMVFDESDEGQTVKEKNPEWRDAMTVADGLIVVAPEYNHSFPGSLKYALDMLLNEYNHKTVGVVGVSGGGFGGTRVIESLVPILRYIGLVVSSKDLNVSHVQDAFNEKGELLDEKLPKRTEAFLSELLWLTETLRWGRENVASDRHE
jgi:NAD(P)H-dependent FMN reductase